MIDALTKDETENEEKQVKKNIQKSYNGAMVTTRLRNISINI